MRKLLGRRIGNVPVVLDLAPRRCSLLLNHAYLGGTLFFLLLLSLLALLSLSSFFSISLILLLLLSFCIVSVGGGGVRRLRKEAKPDQDPKGLHCSLGKPFEICLLLGNVLE